MVDAIPYMRGIRPHKLLCVVKPSHLKLFLADGTDAVGQHGVVRDGYPVLSATLRGATSKRAGFVDATATISIWIVRPA